MARHGENIRKRKDGHWKDRYAVYSKEKNRILTANRTTQQLYAENHKTKTVFLETEPKSLYSRPEIL